MSQKKNCMKPQPKLETTSTNWIDCSISREKNQRENTKLYLKKKQMPPPPTPTIFQAAIALNPPMRLAPTMTIPPMATTSWPPTIASAYWAYPPIYAPFPVHATPMFTKVKHPYLIFDNGIDWDALLKLLT